MKYIDVSKVGKAKVIVDIVQKGNPEVRPAYSMKPTQIAVHNTGNPSKGAGAEMHNRYIHNQASYSPKDTNHASWHFSVDDKLIYQHIPLDESAWHTGDGSSVTSGNRTAIGIEICMNPDMDYAQAEENAIALIVYLMKKLNIKIQKVKPHQAFSGKYCPAVILKRDGGFTKFSNRIESAYSGKKVTSGSKPTVVQTDSTPSLVKRGQRGSYVTNLQKDLKALGYSLAVDGIFGADTEKAVRQLQSDSGISVDGIAGKITISAISKRLASSGGSFVGKRVESIYKGKEGLNFYSRASWDKKYKAGVLAYGIGFPYVLDKVKVDGSYMYKAKNSKGSVFYVTASSKYVKLEGAGVPVAKKAPKSSGIKSVGKIKLTGVNNFTYIYSKTSDKSTKLGEAHKNAVYEIAGSVPNWYEIIYKGKRAYIKEKYASRV